jgi:hypothetical protein
LTAGNSSTEQFAAEADVAGRSGRPARRATATARTTSSTEREVTAPAGSTRGRELECGAGLGIVGSCRWKRCRSVTGRRLEDWDIRSPVVRFNAALTRLPSWTAAPGERFPALGTVDVTTGLAAA